MKRIALLALCLCAAAGVRAENISVATFNVWSGLTYRGFFSSGSYEDGATREFRYDLLVSGLTGLAPDLIALQEANPLPAFADRFAEDLGYDQVSDVRQGGVRIGPVGLPANLREGSVILADTGRSLTRLDTRNLVGPRAGNVASFQFSSGSQIIAARIEVEDRPVYVFTTRWTPSPPADPERMQGLVTRYAAGDLSAEEFTSQIEQAVSGRERRRSEARETLKFINELAGENPVILLGSLYALPASPELDVLRAGGFLDVWQSVGRGPGYTWDAQTNSNIAANELATDGAIRERYDYILIRGNGIVARSARIIFSQPTFGVHASDHYGLFAELRIDPAP